MLNCTFIRNFSFQNNLLCNYLRNHKFWKSRFTVKCLVFKLSAKVRVITFRKYLFSLRETISPVCANFTSFLEFWWNWSKIELWFSSTERMTQNQNFNGSILECVKKQIFSKKLSHVMFVSVLNCGQQILSNLQSYLVFGQYFSSNSFFHIGS